MRNIFQEHKQGWVRLQQGALFSGAIADGIDGCQEIFGLVITPRCDISNKKVSTIHYLPVIPFRIWKYEILSRLYCNTTYEKLSKKLKEFCRKNGIADSLFDKTYHFSEEDIESSISHISGYKDILNTLEEREQLNSIEYCKSKVTDWSKGKDKIKELIDNKQAHYYLIEDWRNENDYFVIMLRDVKRITFEFAERLEKGVSERILMDVDYLKNDILQSSNGTMVYKFQQTVASPYLEHIMEAFSKNFCRIGIDRIEESVLEQLKEV